MKLKTTNVSRWLLATALGTLAIAPAYAQTTADTAEQAGSSTPGSTTRDRFDGTADAGDSDIVVTGSRGSANGVTNSTPGGGLMSVQTGTKLRSTITRDYIDVQAGTTNSFTLIRNLPGVVLGSGDPFGSAPNLTIRGLSQTSLGFNFEGMPIGDQLSYSAFPSEWSDTENVGQLNLTRGSTDITAPVYNSVGALLQSELIMPPRNPGAFASVSVGNYGLRRYFLRLETGEIGNTGIRGFVSGSRTFSEAWRGPGVSYRNHIDSKFVKEFANGDTISLVATYNESNSTAGARNPTLAQYAQFGKDFAWNADYVPGSNTNNEFYRLRANDRQSLSVSMPSTFTLTDNLDVVVTPYYLYTHGITNGASNLNLNGAFFGNQPTGPLVAPGAVINPNGTATMMNVDYYDQHTYGQNSYLRWNVGLAQFRLGYWYSNFTHTELSAYQPVSAEGTVRDTFGKTGSVTLQDGRILRNFAARIEQNVNGVYADMTTKLADDKLLINFGFKFVWVDRTATSELPGNPRVDSLSAKPLPQASIRYSFDDRNQVFADITTAFRAPSAVSSYINIYNVATGVPSSTPAATFNPEYSVGQEIGFRHHGDLVHFTIAAFNYDLTDRLVQGTQLVGGTNVGFAVNVGDQSARGVEAEIGLVPYKGFSPYVSGQYLKATTRDDYPTRGVYLPTSGKRAALSPEWVGSAGLRFDNGKLFALLEGSYVSSQYSTFMNDQELPSYHVLNGSLGYRFDTIGFIKKPQFTLNMTNLTDEKQLVGIQGVTSNALPTRSTDGTMLIPAANPTYTIGGGFGITASLSAAF